jgi:hypothetical protein
MPSSGGRFSQFQKDYLKQLIVECEVQRLTVEECMAYIKEKLKDEISVEHYYYLKRQIKKNLDTKLSYLRKDRTMFIAEIFFRRVSELEKLQKEQWRLYNKNADNPYLQKDCLHELHQLTITLANMYDALPQLTGLSFLHNYKGQNSFSEFLEAGSRKEPSSPVSSESRSFSKDNEPVV